MKKTIFGIALTLVCMLFFYHFGRGVWYPTVLKVKGHRTVDQVVSEYGEISHANLLPMFTKAGISYPPNKLALIAFKDIKVLEVWAANNDSFQRVKSYPIKAASGQLGPKLREGDKQVPEGIYKIIGFNPNSAFHLSLKLNYPNAFDLKHARAEGRDQPGTNIFMHGYSVSVGCLAMGNEAIEEIFSLVHATGRENTTVLISPTDPSYGPLTVPKGAPNWTSGLYKTISKYYSTINPKSPHTKQSQANENIN